MMTKSGIRTMAASMAVSLSLATAALAQAPAAPIKGDAVLASVQVTATVTHINHVTRLVTIKADDGQLYTFVADPSVQNLAQVQKGDLVTVTYTEAVAYEVKKGGKADAAAAAVGAAAPLGAKPAGVVGDAVTVTAVISAINPKVPSVTFKGPEGNSKTVNVKDPAKLKGVSVGDTVQLTYAEALAMKVEKAAKK
jgi:hypothetical protein